jgi:uncharacterized protein (TIGR03437 family)
VKSGSKERPDGLERLQRVAPGLIAASDAGDVRGMRWLALLLCCAALASAGTNPPFPAGVHPIQRIDQQFPWLSPGCLTIDRKGNFFIGGTTTTPPPNIPVLRGHSGGQDIVLIKLDPAGQLVFAVLIGGSNGDDLNQMRTDATGNLYAQVRAHSTDFPTTTGPAPTPDTTNYVLKLDPNGTLVYSTVLSWAGSFPGFEVDSNGKVYVSGNMLGANNLPVSPAAFQKTPASSVPCATGFLAQLSASGEKIEAATYLPCDGGKLVLRKNGDVLVAMQGGIRAFDPSLSRQTIPAFGGNTGSGMFAAEDGSGNIFLANDSTLWIYSPDGSRLLAATPHPNGISALTVTASGLAYLLGLGTPLFSTTNGSQPCYMNLAEPFFGGYPPRPGVLAVIDVSGKTRYATFLQEAIVSPGLVTISPVDGRPYGIGSTFPYSPPFGNYWTGILAFDTVGFPEGGIFAGCLAHSATLASSAIAPGALMTIIGEKLGPDTGVSYTPENGRIPFNVAGTSVTVDGMPAPILYAQSRQINFVTPWGIRTDGARIPVCAKFSDATSCFYAETAAAAPGFFNVGDSTAATNEDGTANSRDNPAHPGSYVLLYMTGAGPLTDAVPDGGIADLVPKWLAASATVKMATLPGICIRVVCPKEFPADTLYAGWVPTWTNGAQVLIIRLPLNSYSGSPWVEAAFDAGNLHATALGHIYIAP